MLKSWGELKWFLSDDQKRAMERLNAEEAEGITINPTRDKLFYSLVRAPFNEVKVCIVGQDPYPNPQMCTGIAFSIPANYHRDIWPATLVNILTEYVSDLGHPWPATGNLEEWCCEGVLLWNCYPSCEAWRSASHRWPEWEALTKEVVQSLDERGDVVFVFLGAHARKCCDFSLKSQWISTSHPSPLGYNKGFQGSRLFSRVNALLGKNPVDWKLT